MADLVAQAITRCPVCKTLFRVTEDQLRFAEGAVRCGSCLHVFQAEEQFVSPLLDVTEALAIEADYWQDFETWILQIAAPQQELPLEFPPEPEPDPEALLPVVEEVSDESATEDTQFPEMDWQANPEGAAEETPVELEAVANFVHMDEAWHEQGIPNEISIDLDHDDHHSSIVQDHRKFRDWGGLKWIPGIALMIGLGFVQYAYFFMDTYAQVPEYRAHYLTACRYLPCDLPEYDNLDRLRTRELVVRSHPGESNALIVDVLLLNEAPFRQIFPGLKLSFFNLKGEKVASRVFGVPDYLGGEMRGLRFIPARTEVRLSLELVDPGKDALGYEMEVVKR